MLLSDKEIRWLCRPDGIRLYSMIEPFVEGTRAGGVISYGLTSAGYDLRLANEFYLFKSAAWSVVDAKRFSDVDYAATVLEKTTVKTDIQVRGIPENPLPP